MNPIKAKFSSKYGCSRDVPVTILAFVGGSKAVIVTESGMLSEVDIDELMIEEPRVRGAGEIGP